MFFDNENSISCIQIPCELEIIYTSTQFINSKLIFQRMWSHSKFKSALIVQITCGRSIRLSGTKINIYDNELQNFYSTKIVRYMECPCTYTCILKSHLWILFSAWREWCIIHWLIQHYRSFFTSSAGKIQSCLWGGDKFCFLNFYLWQCKHSLYWYFRRCWEASYCTPS